MKCASVPMSTIAKHPYRRLDASYWLGEVSTDREEVSVAVSADRHKTAKRRLLVALVRKAGARFRIKQMVARGEITPIEAG